MEGAIAVSGHNGAGAADDDAGADMIVNDSTVAVPPADSSAAEQQPAESGDPPPRSDVRLALVIGVVVVLTLTGLLGWLGYRAYDSHRAQQQRNLFIRVGRQSALNLTTISFTEAAADVQRILDSSTGDFYDDFQKRSSAFVDVVKQAQSKSEGTVVEAGLESQSSNQGKVIVAVTVTSSNAGEPNQPPRAWRMRMTVQKVGDDAKVSQVEFVP